MNTTTNEQLNFDEAFKFAKLVLETAGLTGNKLAIGLDKIYKHYTGISVLETAGIQLEEEKKEAYTPAQIAETLGLGKGRKGARIVNKLLESAGYQYWAGDHWEPTEKGKPYAVVEEIMQS